MVRCEGDAILIVGTTGEHRAVVERRAIDLFHSALAGIGIADREEVIADVRALDPPIVDEIRFWWRAGDPGEMDVFSRPR